MNIGWYARRMSRMSSAELAHRARDQVIKLLWRRLQGSSADVSGALRSAEPLRFATPLPAGAAGAVPETARAALLESADLLMSSRWPVFSQVRSDLGPDPDWFLDVSTNRRAPELALDLPTLLRPVVARHADAPPFVISGAGTL